MPETPLVLAHRGGHEPESAGVRENTLAAFAAAHALGADGLELDVRSVAGGGLVVDHDPLPPPPFPEWVPMFDAAVAACSGLGLLNVEIKNLPNEPDFDPSDALVEPIVAALAPRLASHGADGIIVSSFWAPTVAAFHAAAPSIPTGLLTMSRFDQLTMVAAAAEAGHRAINPPEGTVTAEVVAAAHGAGLRVMTWTVNDPARMVELAAMGVDVVITDVPALALATFGRSPT